MATVETEPRGAILKLVGKLEYESVRDFERAGDELTAAKPAKAVVDASQLAFLNSAGIGAVIKLHRRLEEFGSELRLASVNADVLRMLKLCYFDRVLKIFASVDEALST